MDPDDEFAEMIEAAGPPPSDAEVAQAFQVQAQVFDLDLPWTTDGGRVLNKFGVRVGHFDNWEAADAIVAMMNGSMALMEAAAALQQAAPVPAPALAPATVSTSEIGEFILGARIKVDPALPPGTVYAVTETQLREIEAAQVAAALRAGAKRPDGARVRFS